MLVRCLANCLISFDRSHDRKTRDYINDGLSLYNTGAYQKSIQAAQAALKLQPDSAIAYNNICTAYNQMKQWDQAIAACGRALAIQPDFELAKNNLRVAQERKP